MATRRRTPYWLSRLVIEAIHADQIREHGGLPGVRDEHALESALARPCQRWQYGDKVDPAGLAAAYAFALVRAHPFRDGNKRIGFLALVTFLDVNGVAFEAAEPEVVKTMIRLASGSLSERELANWVRARIVS